MGVTTKFISLIFQFSVQTFRFIFTLGRHVCNFFFLITQVSRKIGRKKKSRPVQPTTRKNYDGIG